MSIFGAAVCSIIREDNTYRRFIVMFGFLLKIFTLIIFVACRLAVEREAAEEAAHRTTRPISNDEEENERRSRSNYPRRRGVRSVYRRLDEVHPITN